MSIETTIEMLDELRAVLVRTQEGKLNGRTHTFDMWVWARSEEECGTSACALGSYAMSPEGDLRGFGVEFTPGRTALTFDGVVPPNFFQIINTAAKKFGIETQESHYLFDPDHYANSELEMDNRGLFKIPQSAVLRHVEHIRDRYLNYFKYGKPEHCPQCGDTEVEAQTRAGDMQAPDTNYLSCGNCGYQWGHE